MSLMSMIDDVYVSLNNEYIYPRVTNYNDIYAMEGL